LNQAFPGSFDMSRPPTAAEDAACLAAQGAFDALAEAYGLGDKSEAAELRRPPMCRPRR
jgi:hypothetical protein